MTSPRADVSRRKLARASVARAGAWQIVSARGIYWRRMTTRASDVENSGGAWRRVEGPMKTKIHRKADRREFVPMM